MLLDNVSSLRDVAAKFDIPIGTLHRHRVNHQGWVVTSDNAERMAKENRRRELMAAESRIAYLEAKLPTREELGEKLEDCIARLDNIVTKHEKAGGVDTIALRGLGEMRATVADLAKLAGHVGGTAPTVNVGVQVNMNANDIGAAIAQHLSAADPSLLIEATADEY